MAFPWWANDSPLIVVFGSYLPSSTKKKTQKKTTSNLDPFWQNFLDPPMHHWELVTLLYLCSCCPVAVSSLCLFFMVPWVGLQCLIVAFSHGWKFSGLFLNSGFWGWLSVESQPQNAESGRLYSQPSLQWHCLSPNNLMLNWTSVVINSNLS